MESVRKREPCQILKRGAKQGRKVIAPGWLDHSMPDETRENIRWNPATQEWFCMKCGRTSDHTTEQLRTSNWNCFQNRRSLAEQVFGRCSRWPSTADALVGLPLLSWLSESALAHGAAGISAVNAAQVREKRCHFERLLVACRSECNRL
jgi:hypothetical protein